MTENAQLNLKIEIIPLVAVFSILDYICIRQRKSFEQPFCAKYRKLKNNHINCIFFTGEP